MYENNNNLNNELLKNLCDLYSFEKPIDFIFINNKNINIELNLKTNVNISKLMNNLNTYLSKKINQIDFRPIDKYDYVKKYVRLYENSLNKMLFELGYNINNKKVSRAWIKMYEILKYIKFKKIISSNNNNNNNNNNKNINIFFLCEAPGNFIHSIGFYIKKYLSDYKYIWNATSLKQNGKNNAFGDDYNMIKNNLDLWSYGKDETGDITNIENIKYYKNICNDKDWIIGDCGIPYSDDNEISLRLYFSEILFILYNSKNGSNSIFKSLIPIKYNILMDLYYILFNSYEKLLFYKPMQNKFSPEFYVIGINYKKTVKNFDLLFDILKKGNFKENKYSIIEKYNNQFKYQFIKAINLLH